MDTEHWLFSYGTLRQSEVQQALFGRALHSVPDTLPGYRLEMLHITDAQVVALSGSNRHPVLRQGSPEDRIKGAALAMTADDLIQADRYEMSDYVRIPVALGSGKRAFVYVHYDDRPPHPA